MQNFYGVQFIFYLIYLHLQTDHLFNGWSKQGGQKHNLLLLTGCAAICWAIWLTRNDSVFNNCRPKTLLQVLFRGTHWLRFWALLQRTEDQRDQLVEACQVLESRAISSLRPMDGLSFCKLVNNVKHSVC